MDEERWVKLLQQASVGKQLDVAQVAQILGKQDNMGWRDWARLGRALTDYSHIQMQKQLSREMLGEGLAGPTAFVSDGASRVASGSVHHRDQLEMKAPTGPVTLSINAYKHTNDDDNNPSTKKRTSIAAISSMKLVRNSPAKTKLMSTISETPKAPEPLHVCVDILDIRNVPLNIEYFIKVKLLCGEQKLSVKKTKVRKSKTDSFVFHDQFRFDIDPIHAADPNLHMAISVWEWHHLIDEVIGRTSLKIDDLEAHSEHELMSPIVLEFTKGGDTTHVMETKHVDNEEESDTVVMDIKEHSLDHEHIDPIIMVAEGCLSMSTNGELEYNKGDLIRVVEHKFTEQYHKANMLKGYVLGDLRNARNDRAKAKMFKAQDVKLAHVDDHTGLRHFLEVTSTRVAFHKFLEKEHSTENIDFFEAVNQFSIAAGNLDSLDPELTEAMERAEKDVLQMARHLMSEFVAPDSEQCVNISSKCRKELMTTFQTEPVHVTAEMFDDAQEEIFNVMESDSFQRFKRSPLFQLFKHTSATSIPYTQRRNPDYNRFIPEESLVWSKVQLEQENVRKITRNSVISRKSINSRQRRAHTTHTKLMY